MWKKKIIKEKIIFLNENLEKFLKIKLIQYEIKYENLNSKKKKLT